MSKWFKHYHCWRLKTDVTVRDGEKAAGLLMLEECHCGAIRQIEFKPGQAPVIYTTEATAHGNP